MNDEDGAAGGQRLAGAVGKFLIERGKQQLRFDETAKVVFIERLFVARANLRVIRRRAGIFALE